MVYGIVLNSLHLTYIWIFTALCSANLLSTDMFRLNVEDQTIPVAANLPPGYLSVQPLGLGKGVSLNNYIRLVSSKYNATAFRIPKFMKACLQVCVGFKSVRDLMVVFGVLGSGLCHAF